MASSVPQHGRTICCLVEPSKLCFGCPFKDLVVDSSFNLLLDLRGFLAETFSELPKSTGSAEPIRFEGEPKNEQFVRFKDMLIGVERLVAARKQYGARLRGSAQSVVRGTCRDIFVFFIVQTAQDSTCQTSQRPGNAGVPRTANATGRK
jgi:hypothetical protein